MSKIRHVVSLLRVIIVYLFTSRGQTGTEEVAKFSN